MKTTLPKYIMYKSIFKNIPIVKIIIKLREPIKYSNFVRTVVTRGNINLILT